MGEGRIRSHFVVALRKLCRDRSASCRELSWWFRMVDLRRRAPEIHEFSVEPTEPYYRDPEQTTLDQPPLSPEFFSRF